MQFSNLWGEGVDCNCQGKESIPVTTTPQETGQKLQKKLMKRVQMYQPTVGEDLHIVQQDHLVKTHPANNHNRRTLVLRKENGSWGFTIQTYGIHHKTQDEIEDLTYVDYVEIGGPAFLAGMRKGDIILSVNGTTTDNISHNGLVNIIKTCGETMRLVVLFEDCSRKVELHLRYIKLKKVLAAKEFELNSIDEKLRRLQNRQENSGHRETNSVSASCSAIWDERYSLNPDKKSADRPASYSGTMNYSSLPKNSKVTTPPKVEKKENSNGHVSGIPSSFAVGEPDQFNSLPVSRTKKHKRPGSLALSKRGLLSRSTQNVAVPNERSTPSVSPEGELKNEGHTGSLGRQFRARSSLRSRSFRASFRHTLSPVDCAPHEGSSNYVVTEENSKGSAEPMLLKLKLGNLELQRPSYEEQKRSSVLLKRSLSSPAVKTFSVVPNCEDITVNEKLKRSQSDSGYQNEARNQSIRDQETVNRAGCSQPTQKVTCTQADSSANAQSDKSGCSVRKCTHLFCSDANCNNICVTESVTNPFKALGLDKISDASQVIKSVTRRSKSNENITRASAGTEKKMRPWSTGSDGVTLGSRSSTGSSSSSVSTPSSGTFEFYTDPFTPSPNDLTNQTFAFPQRTNETPILNPFKKIKPKRVLAYSRHKEIVRQELRLMNINEEEEVTRL